MIFGTLGSRALSGQKAKDGGGGGAETAAARTSLEIVKNQAAQPASERDRGDIKYYSHHLLRLRLRLPPWLPIARDKGGKGQHG